MTDKKDEALKLALEALEAHADIGIKSDKAIIAIREALAEQPAYRAVKTFHEGKPVYVAEQPAQQRSLSDMKFGGCPFCGSQSCVAGQCQRPAQEPVAFVNADHLQGLTLGNYGHVEIYTDESAGHIPLYTSPPASKPWVGLTQDELNMIGDRMRTWNSHSLVDVCTAIAAKLREKNA